jgi:hypothetical protein
MPLVSVYVFLPSNVLSDGLRGGSFVENSRSPTLRRPEFGS